MRSNCIICVAVAAICMLSSCGLNRSPDKKASDTTSQSASVPGTFPVSSTPEHTAPQTTPGTGAKNDEVGRARATFMANLCRRWRVKNYVRDGFVLGIDESMLGPETRAGFHDQAERIFARSYFIFNADGTFKTLLARADTSKPVTGKWNSENLQSVRTENDITGKQGWYEIDYLDSTKATLTQHQGISTTQIWLISK